jgi:hypothetical protein
MIRPLAWMGMAIVIVIGMSFLAVPVKFTADSPTRPITPVVARATFHARCYLEWALTITMAALLWRAAARHQRPTDRAHGNPTP